MKGKSRVKIVALICGLLSGAIGALAALAFLKGSKPVPPSAGEDDLHEAEAAHRSTALRWNKIGVALLMGAFLFSAAASLASYLE